MQEIRVYFSGPTLLVLVEILLDRGYPPLKNTPCKRCSIRTSSGWALYEKALLSPAEICQCHGQGTPETVEDQDFGCPIFCNKMHVSAVVIPMLLPDICHFNSHTQDRNT